MEVVEKGEQLDIESRNVDNAGDNNVNDDENGTDLSIDLNDDVREGPQPTRADGTPKKKKSSFFSSSRNAGSPRSSTKASNNKDNNRDNNENNNNNNNNNNNDSDADGIPQNLDYAFLANELVFGFIDLRQGLMLSSILVILNGIIEMIFGAIFEFSWFLWIYVILMTFGGLSGLYGSYYNKAKIIHFFYFCSIGNLMIQTVILIWAGIVYYDETHYIVLMIVEILMTIILWISFVAVMQRYRDLTTRHYSQKLLPTELDSQEIDSNQIDSQDTGDQDSDIVNNNNDNHVNDDVNNDVNDKLVSA